MHNVNGKLISEETLAKIFISFYFCSLEIYPRTQELFLTMLGKNNLITTSNKCSSLTKEVWMILKLRKNIFQLILKTD
jgi:hypothetical protein